ncbi:AAA family ATPase [Paludibacter jiangxiensis]|uniref:AAA ATPase domain-containing protein n=1 Tax=Paludibacter jiangxiensis TaxID=681398 RepID=A0A171AFD3_9BACT|nr:AAA family ATPase [Paludibacter jiangxiensis]GAT63646.1 AAA ATPase domain-containing protein [Paludibacter jiangxiensis]
MRIKHLYISKYKNLKRFSLDFENESFIDVFVGKNGSGKSNMFEALIEIFRHLYENDYQIKFDYQLKYSIDDNTYFVSWDWEKELWLDETNNEIKKITVDKLPDNILIYYSGHNTKVDQLISQYEDKFRKGLLGANEGDLRKFIGIGNEYKSLLLTILLLLPEHSKAKKYILEKLGIKNLSHEFKLVFQRPEYAKKAGYDIDQFEPTTRFWKVAGITKIFMDRIYEVKKGDSKGKVRDEGYFRNGGYNDNYILYYDVVDFQKKFEDLSPQALFRSFDNLKTLGILNDISIEITLHDNSTIDVNQFSDGQFQSIYIYSIVELFKDRTCVTLLDEPDSFLHPEWQYGFLTQIEDITAESSACNHILMTSHSAITLIPHAKDNINLIVSQSGVIQKRSVNKAYAIQQLSSDILRYRENEQILSLLHKVKLKKQPIIFTEGSTDPEIIKTAWGKLYDKPMPFSVIYAFNCNYLRLLIQDERILNEINGKPIFGLFDFDKAYNEWNYIKEDSVIENNPLKGLAKKIKDKNSFALMLPIPNNPTVQKQVIKKLEPIETYKDESEMEIEHLFYSDENTHSYFTEEAIKGGGTIVKFRDNKKTEFAQEIVPSIDKEHFEVFRPMFELIMSKIS